MALGDPPVDLDDWPEVPGAGGVNSPPQTASTRLHDNRILHPMGVLIMLGPASVTATGVSRSFAVPEHSAAEWVPAGLLEGVGL
jgi:hypothetical protein